ncbi:hypothetical protein ASF05_12290 [Aeromicrobium sp. Leaf245]|nr:hypothetical protein ASF05_12290 [Aeromicrobium sp. Leaf245]
MTYSQRRRLAGTNHEAPESSNGQADDYLDLRAEDDVLARIRQRAACDPRKARRHEQRRARRRQQFFDSFVRPDPIQPNSWGMTADELRDYAAQLRRQGWSDWEIRARLADPRAVAA